MSYSALLKDPRWQKKRLYILGRDNFKCKKCGEAEKQLQIHHWKYSEKPWEIEDEYLDTLCSKCHNEYENDFKETWQYLGRKQFMTSVNFSSTIIQITHLSTETRKLIFKLIDKFFHIEYIKKES